MRVFYALTFKKEDKDRIAVYRDQVANISDKGRFILTDNIHLTLEFIGNIRSDELKFYEEALDGIPIEPLELTINRLGKFKKKNKDIIWLGLEKNDDLMDLQKNLIKHLEELGHESERGKYRPHITLGRQVIIGDNLNSIYIEPLRVKAHSVALMESKRVNDVLVYEVLDEVILDQ